jgi:hypothetical protein
LQLLRGLTKMAVQKVHIMIWLSIN